MNQILWADDEIDLLKPYIIFLQEKGYSVLTANNGQDAIDYCRNEPLDIVFLDENMPGLSGLETLETIKSLRPSLPVVMITKSEEERIMEQAIGAKIADYLIKPVNPNQILLCLKKHIHQREIVEKHTNRGYQEEFSDISFMIDTAFHLHLFLLTECGKQWCYNVFHASCISFIKTFASSLSCLSSVCISFMRWWKSTPSSSTSATPT